MRAPFLLAGLIVGALAALPADAQVRNTASASLPAFVQMEQAGDPPLQLAVVNPVDFGRVTIPNQFRSAEAVCEYKQTVDAGRLLSEPGAPFTSDSGVTTSGCRFIQTGAIGKLALTCLAQSNLMLTMTYRSGTVAGLTLVAAERIRVADADGANAQIFPATSGRIRCFPTSTLPASSVMTRHISFGGVLRIRRVNDMPVGNRVEAGTILVEAQYE
ncbi:MAG: hypothetical protein ABW039_08110 [Sphingobium sp.]